MTKGGDLLKQADRPLGMTLLAYISSDNEDQDRKIKFAEQLLAQLTEKDGLYITRIKKQIFMFEKKKKCLALYGEKDFENLPKL